MFFIFLSMLSACSTMSLNGAVKDGAGQPLEGVRVHAAGSSCSTETDATGQFELECTPGVIALTFSKANHIAQETRIDALEKKTYAVPDQTLTRLPESSGLFVLQNGNYVPLQSGALERKMRSQGGALQRDYCLQNGQNKPTKLRAGDISLFDHNAPGWRLFRLDSDRCAYRDTRNARGRWVVTYREKPDIKSEALGKDLVRHRATLTAGHYFAATWKGFFAASETEPSMYGGFWFQVED